MDSKIINFSDILLKAHEQENDRDAILDVVVLPAITELIQEAGLNPMCFTSDDASLKEFENRPITYKEVDGTFCSVYYDSKTKNAIYRAECRITLDGDFVNWTTDLYMLKDYLSGNREWLYFCDGAWQSGPGDDYFDLQDFLGEVTKHT